MDPSKDETIDLKPSKAGTAAASDRIAPAEPAPPPAEPQASAPPRGADRATAMSIAELLLLGMEESNCPGKGKKESGRWVGKVLGDYRLDEELGRGGMGIVFRATNTRVGSTVALKLLRFAPGETAERLRRFEMEARAAAALNHPNIINVFDVGQVGDLYYLAMEYIEGRPLSDLVEAGPLDPLQAVRITMDVCNALEFAHEAGVIHRDIKPSNILIEASGRAQLMDFGLARSIPSEGSQRKLTEEGSILGTVHYMSPEQALGQGHLADSRSDLYAVGAVIYEMLTGLPPFDGNTPLEVVRKVAHDEPVPPRKLRSAIDRDLEVIVLKAMDKDPTRRYVSAAALREDLWRYHSGEPIFARAPNVFYRAGKFLRRNRSWTIPAGLALIGVLAAIVAVPMHDDKLRQKIIDANQEEVKQNVRDKILKLETEDLGDPLRERWRLVHALRIDGQAGEALVELAHLVQTSPRFEKDFDVLLWRAILTKEAGQPAEEAFKAVREAAAAGPGWRAALVDAYTNPEAAQEPDDETARILFCYHRGHAAWLRGDRAEFETCMKRAADGPPELLETRCAAVELAARAGKP
ncbi:MAG: serine/threonine protein kinase [Planctomycetota bacterium]|nr:serine/threonine protein kinase [Planctomycetota bacterium]